MVANLLGLARIEAETLEPRRQAVDLRELVVDSAARLGRLGSTSEVVVDLPPDLPWVHADYTLVEQTMRNLLENALRHSPDGAPVVVRGTADDRTVSITVADRGPGVAAADRATIFEPFRTGATAGTSGIGLAICKAVAEAHGGTIAVGGSPDGGAEFTVTLPLDPAAR